jgi:AcrR family transcriptional regulator
MVDLAQRRQQRQPRVGRPRGDRRTRERALTAAVALFAARGLSGTRLSDVAAAVQVSNASVLHHFPSMKALYAAVLARIAASVQQAVAHDEAAAPAEPMARIVALIASYFDWTAQNDDYARVLLRELIDNRERAGRARRWYLADVVDRGIERVRAAQAEAGLRFDATAFVVQAVGAIAYFFAARPTLLRIRGARAGADRAAEFRRELLANTEALLRGYARAPKEPRARR